MANIKVSEMTEATSFDDGDYTMIVQANQSKKISKENLFDGIEDEISDININIGDLTELKTQVTTNLVSAINDIIDKDIYSTNEIKTNKVWIDGKPIYRKVVSGTGNSGIIATISNLGQIITMQGVIYSQYAQWWNIPNYHNSTNYWTSIFRDNNGINITTGSFFNNESPYIVILEYTKTTD